MEEASPALRPFVEAAHNLFGIGGNSDRGRKNPFYIEVPAIVSEGQLPNQDELADFSRMDPIIFLSGIRSGRKVSYFVQNVAPAPSLCIVAGQYGLGKTELVYQICDYILTATDKDPNAPVAIPINLALCRGLGAFTADPSPETLATLVFQHVLRLPVSGRIMLSRPCSPRSGTVEQSCCSTAWTNCS